MDFRRFLRAILRYKVLIALVAFAGLVCGAAYTLIKPPMLTSKTWVELASSRFIQTQVLIASSNPVLDRAIVRIHPTVSLQTLRNRIHVSTLTSNVLQFEATGSTASQAEGIANAVAYSYLSYVGSPSTSGGKVSGQVFEVATSATGSALRTRVFDALAGALLGAIAGTILAVGLASADKRLRERDQIADAVGLPVLASIPVSHPTDAAGWTRLLDSYEPGVVQAWGMRKALRHLGLTDSRGAGSVGASVAVITLSNDKGAVALGPQLASFSASLGIPTTLVVGPQQEAHATATLCAACSVTSAVPSGRRFNMRVSVGEQGSLDLVPTSGVTIVVAVVDSRVPEVTGTMRTSATVLGVSAGAVTAEQLAQVAIATAADGRDIAGILIADPDPTDNTTGRLPQPMRPVSRTHPTRISRATETMR